jgi:hypothetical protein
MITTEQKIKLFKLLHKSNQTSDMFLDSIPSSIKSVFFDNPHVEELHAVNSTMRKLIFGKDIDSIDWFLYEWRPGLKVRAVFTEPGAAIEITIVKVINNIDDYIDWIVEHEGFE